VPKISTPAISVVPANRASCDDLKAVFGTRGDALKCQCQRYEIATELFISPATAKTHVSRAMSKLGARDRAQLVVLAYESGLLLPRVRST